MELEKLVRERGQARRVFTRTANQTTLKEVDYMYLKEKVDLLATLDKGIHDAMLSAEDFDETEFGNEYDECEKYQRRWLELKATRKLDAKNTENSDIQTVKKEGNLIHNLKLPKLEIRKFDDNPKTWLSFWGQFRKIHEDDKMDEEDKFQYLIQAMAEGSKARTMVDSYPPSKENYTKVIDTLKTRFAKDEILIEIYVRELLKLVVSKNNLSIDVLYDNIVVNLQILESLGIVQGKYECILLPLIESSLPDNTLILWSKVQLKDESKLNQLLAFLEKEVEAESRCRLARTALTDNTAQEVIPTAACLVSKEVRKEKPSGDLKEGKELCYFCERPHNSLECGKANSLNLEERKEAIKNKGGCYICLKRGHMAKFCKSFVKCLCCAKRHLVILCPNIHCEQKKEIEINEKPQEKEEAISNFSSNDTTTTLLQTLVVKISSGSQERKVRALLDSGSQRTYVKAGLVEELGLQVTGTENLGHSLFGGIKKTLQVHRLIKFQVSSLDNSYQTTMTALEQDVLCGTLPKVQDPNIINNLQKLCISLTDPRENISEISVLIGSDYLGSILKGNFIHVTDSLVAIPTKLGWTLQGPIQGVYNTTVSAHFVSTMQQDTLEFMWNLETLGIKDPYEKLELPECEILKNFNNNISVNEEERYEVGLLWKVGRPELQSNYNHAYKRLQSTTKKLETMEQLEEYHKVFKDWEKEGIIKVVQHDVTEEGHYLPHHAVVKLGSTTTKIRPVFDASCKDRNMNSLNECIEKGPNLIEVIPKLLIMFRAGNYGIISDIKKAFLQIAISTPDRKYLKFLWWKDVTTKEDLVTYEHTRVPFGVACSPFLLAATINHHLEKNAGSYPKTVKRLKESYYVDNCVTSFDTEAEVEIFKKEAIDVMNKGKFELTGWMTNSAPEQAPVSVLGIQWNKQTDDLCCNINLRAIPEQITKRDLLSVTQQIFDPVGFLSPVTLVPKLITQKAWLLKTGWDEKIPMELEKEYKHWISTIDSINQCRIRRRLTDAPLKDCKVSIHTFCDASKDAYAGCVFLRTEHKGQVTVQLIIAKSRIAPIKRQMTLPRLELMGAVIASRLYGEVMKSGLLTLFEDYKVFFWTDSAVVLAWLKRQDKWKAFVTNRVDEICKNTNKDDWNHLPGTFNPADLPSRGCNPKTLLETQWWNGPQWLYLEEEDWPKSNIPRIESEEEAIASERSKSIAVHVEVNTDDFSHKLMYFNRYRKIVRVVAWLLRMSPETKKKYNISSKHIGYEEYRNAEESLIKIIQRETYTEQNNKENKLITIEERGILKLKTRLEYSKEDRDFVYPILLPGKNEIVQRMVQQKHREMKHAGTQIMMSELRKTYWITGIRRLTKKIVSQCIKCKRYTVKHYEAPQPPLPADRVSNTAPFQVTGIDLAGPLFLKNNQKCWIVLYTCAVYRAIHLELTDSLSTSSFTMTLRRFISRRGRPKIIYTDNGTNFLGTANLLQEVNWQEVEDSTNAYEIQWKFSVPAAPWWGGWWERLVRVVKDILRRILGRASIDWIELSTILCDCESVINSRPLTYVEMGDVRPLTPLMFLQCLPVSETPDLDEIDHKNLNIRFKYIQQLREDFRKRFKSEYLALLISKGKENRKEPKVGEIVLVETASKRLYWPIGIIKEIFTGKDGSTRVARVQTAVGEKVRAYQKLYPLEVQAASQEWLNNVPRPPRKDSSSVIQDGSAPTPLVTTTRLGRNIKLPSRFLE